MKQKVSEAGELSTSVPKGSSEEKRAPVTLWALPLTLAAGIIAICAIFIWAGFIEETFTVVCIAIAVFAINLLLRAAARLVDLRLETPKWLKRTCSAVLIATTFLLATGALIYVVQDDMLLYNVHDEESRTALAGNPKYSEVEFVAANGKTYHGMLYRSDASAAVSPTTGQGDTESPATASAGSATPTTTAQTPQQSPQPTSQPNQEPAPQPAPLIIYFGGNGEVSYSFMQNREQSGLWSYYADYNLLFIDYEGYGLNDGQPSGQNMLEESLAVYDFAATLPDIDSSRIVVMGFSLGTGPATYLASQRPVAGLILLAPYANGKDLYNAMLPVFHGPTELLVKHKLPSDEYAPDVSCDTLIAASLSDESVPYESSQRLSNRIAGRVNFVELENVNHNGVISDIVAKDAIREFLQEVAK